VQPSEREQTARDKLLQLAGETGLDIKNGRVRRTSSRFCLGVEHGDYNGTELFGVGTDRFIWMGFKANGSGRVRLFSGNFPDDGVIAFEPGKVPPPESGEAADSWARFPFGVDHVLRREGFVLENGMDAVVWGDIPGGGMSRSASLCLNLILSFFDVNDIEKPDEMRIVDLAQAVENDYIGSPCGKLDQIMILFAKEGKGTHYNPVDCSISHVPLGSGTREFRFVSLDTGTVRPGLEKSTYKVRRAECEELVALAGDEFGITTLADVRDSDTFESMLSRFQDTHPDLCSRMSYIYYAQKRFYEMLDAWKSGDIEKVGAVFRRDGIGLRDLYRISGPELECMCDIARTVPGVLGERMLGGGDKGAAGALVTADSVDALRSAVGRSYPRSYPGLSEKYALHVCSMVDGVRVFDVLL